MSALVYRGDVVEVLASLADDYLRLARERLRGYDGVRFVRLPAPTLSQQGEAS